MSVASSAHGKKRDRGALHRVGVWLVACTYCLQLHEPDDAMAESSRCRRCERRSPRPRRSYPKPSHAST